jgi:hypothetical protein
VECREHPERWGRPGRNGERPGGPRGEHSRAPAVPASRAPPRSAAALSTVDRPERDRPEPGHPQEDQPQRERPEQNRPGLDRPARESPEQDGRARVPGAPDPGSRRAGRGESHPGRSARPQASPCSPGRSSPARFVRSRPGTRARHEPVRPVRSRPGPESTVRSRRRWSYRRWPGRKPSRRAATRAARRPPAAAPDPAVPDLPARPSASKRTHGRCPAGPWLWLWLWLWPGGEHHAGRALRRPRTRAPSGRRGRPVPRHLLRKPGRGAKHGRRPVSHSFPTMAQDGTRCAVRQCNGAEKQAARAGAYFPARAAL